MSLQQQQQQQQHAGVEVEGGRSSSGSALFTHSDVYSSGTPPAHSSCTGCSWRMIEFRMRLFMFTMRVSTSWKLTCVASALHPSRFCLDLRWLWRSWWWWWWW